MSFNKCMFCKHCVQNSLEKYMCLNSEVDVGLVDLNNECDEFIKDIRNKNKNKGKYDVKKRSR